MSLRQLAIDIAFSSDINNMLRVDSAVDSIRDNAVDAGVSIGELAGSSDSASSTMLQNFTKVGDGMQDIGKKMSLAITAPLTAAGTAGFVFAKDQEMAFAQVSTLLDRSSTDMDAYKNDIRALSSEMGIAFEDVAESVYSSMSAGQDQADAIEFTRKATMLAGGGFTQTANAVDVMTTALNAYKLESSEATNISDMLITTQNLGKTTVDALSQSMGAVIPIAQAQGVEFDQLAAGYAVLTKNGVNTAEAGTGLKSMFSELGKAGSQVDEILREKTGKSFSGLQEAGLNTGDVLGILQEEANKSGLKLSDLFGNVRSGGAALTLAAGDGAEFNEFLSEMGNSAGATEEAFNIMADTTGDKMSVAWTSIKNTMASVMDIVLPYVAEFAVKIAGVATSFSNLSPSVKMAILVIGGILAAIGPVLLFFGKLLSSIAPIVGAFSKVTGAIKGAGGVIALLTNPITIAIAAIGLIIGAVILAYNKVEWFRDALDAAWEWIKGATATAFEWIKEIISSVLSSVMEFVGGILAKLTEFWSAHGEQIMNLVQDKFNSIMGTIQMVMGIIQGIFQIVWPIISETVKAAWDLIQLVINTAIDIVLGLISVGMSLLQGDWQGAWDAILGIANDIWNNIIGYFEGIDLYEIGANILQGLIDGIGSMASAVGDKIKGIADGIAEKFTGALQIFSPSRLFKEYGINTMLGYTIGFEDEGQNAVAAAESTALDLAGPFEDSFDDSEGLPGDDGNRDDPDDYPDFPTYDPSPSSVPLENQPVQASPTWLDKLEVNLNFPEVKDSEGVAEVVKREIKNLLIQLNAGEPA